MTDTTTASSLVRELARVFKATVMYPSGHPSRVRFFQKLHAGFSASLAQDPALEFNIEGNAITWSGIGLDMRDGSNNFLARECFDRQISSIRFLRGLTTEDLEIFFDLLSVDVEEMRAGGGAVEFIRGRGSGSLQIEQVDYEGILERRIDLKNDGQSHYGAETFSPVAPPEGKVVVDKAVPRITDDDKPEMSQDEWLDAKLRELDAADSAEIYKAVLKDIMDSLRETGGLGMPHYTTVVLIHLGRYLLKEVSEEIAEFNSESINTLGQPAAIEEIVSMLTTRDLVEREVIEAILFQTRAVSLPVLLRRLAEETGTFGRKMIIGFLVKFGPDLKPYLARLLQDDRWFVVRNALGLLQEVGGPQDADEVSNFLRHPHPKIRLEALRFLNRYPVPVEEGLMNSLLNDEDPEVQARAVYALGVLLGPRGLQRLKILARKPFFGEGNVARREMAIKGIGHEGGQKSIQFLSGLLRAHSFVNPSAGERIQKAAVDALAGIGGPRVIFAFRRSLPRLKGQALREAEDFLRKEGGEER